MQITNIIEEIQNETALAGIDGERAKEVERCKTIRHDGRPSEGDCISQRDGGYDKGYGRGIKQQATVSDQVAKSVENISSTTRKLLPRESISFLGAGKLADNLQHLVEQFKI